MFFCIWNSSCVRRIEERGQSIKHPHTEGFLQETPSMHLCSREAAARHLENTFTGNLVRIFAFSPRKEGRNTLSELFLILINFPSASISSMEMLPKDEERWTTLKQTRWPGFFTPVRFLFFPCRKRRPWVVAVGNPTLSEEGLDSFNL